MANWWAKFMTRLSAATKAFNKPDIISDPLDLDADFNDWKSRRLRYDLSWAFYENTAYIEEGNRSWPQGYKTQFGLDRYIRNIYNPAYRLGEFWKAHLWGGPLDAIPLMFPDDEDTRLLDAIQQIWEWSNWETQKDVVPLYGAVMGDVGIIVRDDIARQKVFFDVIHPGNLVDVDLDTQGNVKAYEFQEERRDPMRANSEASATYSEIAVRNGDDVIYTTLLNGKPFAWPENQIDNGDSVSSWVRPYGFIPMVLIQHNNVGLQWGWSEIHPGQSKFREVDDQGSGLNDQIRKTVRPKWLFSGASAPTTSPTFTETSLTGTAAQNRPQPGREEEWALYGGENASATPLVAPIDIEHAANNIMNMVKEIELDYPELRLMAMFDEEGGNISGRALRIARQPAETKVNQRRPGYYNALVRANQMAVAIAGFNGYEGFAGFGLDSFDRGDLDHSIDKMPIFAIDPADELELLEKKAIVVQTLTQAGATILGAAIQAGFTEGEAEALANQVDLGVER